jgi:hypothetical protein
MIRDDVKAAQIAAMKGGDKETVAATRLISAAIKNRDIELRTGPGGQDDDMVVTEVLQKMIKQRRESIELYRQGSREELAQAEEAEVRVIGRFLPAQMSETEAAAAVDALATEISAVAIQDMGRLMSALKQRYAGQIDMSKASALVKKRLSGAAQTPMG